MDTALDDVRRLQVAYKLRVQKSVGFPGLGEMLRFLEQQMLRTQAVENNTPQLEVVRPMFKSLLEGYTTISTAVASEIASNLRMPASVSKAHFGMSYAEGDPHDPYLRYLTAWWIGEPHVSDVVYDAHQAYFEVHDFCEAFGLDVETTHVWSMWLSIRGNLRNLDG